MMNKMKPILIFVLSGLIFASCKKDVEPLLVAPPSDGNTLTLNGLIANESGSSAGNSVYVDFSQDKQTSVSRRSWDLGFSCGSDFRVILNASASAGIKITTATDLAAISETDTVGLTLAVNQSSPSVADFSFFDAISGNLSGTAIPAISKDPSQNKVIILNRGTGGGIPARPWIKLRITQTSSGGYQLQFGKIASKSNFQTVEIAKNSNFNFSYISLSEGSKISVEPEKENWDIVWGYSLYQTSFSGVIVPYNFSDLIFLNTHAAVKAAQVATADFSYSSFAETDLSSPKIVFSSARDAIGSSWRITQPATGAKTDVFYLIKDPNGNVYKLKFMSMGVGGDGGQRGKPVLEYKLVKKG